jgi:hypothetical protein
MASSYLLAMALFIDGPTYCNSVSVVEQSIAKIVVEPRMLDAFEAIARARKKAGKGLGTDWFCPSLQEDASEVSRDGETNKLLIEYGVSATDYIIVAWSVIVALHPEDFENARISETNIRLIRKRKPSLIKLLYPE